MKEGYLYILTNFNRSTLYIGVTNDIERRVLEHKCGIGSKFTSKYHLTRLLHYENFGEIVQAIDREKQLKTWRREWKWNLIIEENPNYLDLAKDWFTEEEIKEYLWNVGKR